MNIFGTEGKQINIIELFIASEYCLTNYSTAQAVINYAEDNFKPTLEKLGRNPIPDDLHQAIVKSTVLYYTLCKNSGFYKIAIEEGIENNNEEDIKTKIMTPIAAFLCDALTQAMQSTKAIGTALAPYDAVSKAKLLEAGINSLNDIESKKMIEFSTAINKDILTPTIKEILTEESWLEKVNQETISKLIFKTCLFSYLSISINDMLKDIVKKHLKMGVFLNALMMSSHGISTLAIEEKTSSPESTFKDTIASLVYASCFALCMIFENSTKKEEHPAFKFIPAAFDGIANTYNAMIQQVNKTVDENSKKLEVPIEVEKLVELSSDDISEVREEIRKAIQEDISKENQEVKEV